MNTDSISLNYYYTIVPKSNLQDIKQLYLAVASNALKELYKIESYIATDWHLIFTIDSYNGIEDLTVKRTPIDKVLFKQALLKYCDIDFSGYEFIVKLFWCFAENANPDFTSDTAVILEVKPDHIPFESNRYLITVFDLIEFKPKIFSLYGANFSLSDQTDYNNLNWAYIHPVADAYANKLWQHSYKRPMFKWTQNNSNITIQIPQLNGITPISGLAMLYKTMEHLTKLNNENYYIQAINNYIITLGTIKHD